MPLSLSSYPRAILHIDGDAFFASCETAIHPELKGKCVITGKERGIASSMSYEAKARGVTRGMPLHEIRKLCPDAVILPSDYETYSLFSMRMFSIVRRYTSEVEEYSIDECFADITGMRRPLRMSYEAIAEEIKRKLDAELGMTFSIGLAPTKVLAKLASKWKKPSGLTAIPGNRAHLFLERSPVEKLWGVGPQTAAYLNKCGVRSALEFAMKSEDWVRAKLTKPHQEIWRELRGECVYPLNLEEHHDYQSISKTKTFTPASSERTFVHAQLSKNVENACIKARRHNLAAKEAYFFLRTNDFRHGGMGIRFTHAVAAPQEIMRHLEAVFDQVYRPGLRFRATGIVLTKLVDNNVVQQDLFGETTRIEGLTQVMSAMDRIDRKFGKHSVFLGSTFRALQHVDRQSERGDVAKRTTDLFKGENKRQRLAFPMLGDVK